jgi:hypothetical protein
MANAPPDDCGMSAMMKQMGVAYTFEDRRKRAEYLMREIEPDFAPTPWPLEHHDEEEHEEDEEEHEDGEDQ